MSKERSHQLQIWLALIAIAIVNAATFIGLDLIHGNVWQEVIYGTLVAIVLYIFLFFISIIFILLKRAKYVLYTFFLLLAAMTANIFFNLFYLTFNPAINDNGVVIFVDAMLIWLVTLLVFSLWYWIIDAGGPLARMKPENPNKVDFLFPQQQTVIPNWNGWKPEFVDYLFLSFFTGTGFSPADTLPLSKKVKTLMMLEALISLTIIGMIVGRAVALIN